MENRPVGRKKNVGEGGSGVHKRGEGLGIGPVGASDDHAPGGAPSGGSSPQRSSGGRSPLFMIIIIIVLLLGGGGGLSSFLGGSQGDYSDTETQTAHQTTTPQTHPSTRPGSTSDLLATDSSLGSGMSML